MNNKKPYWVPPIMGESIQDMKPAPAQLSSPWRPYMAFIISAAIAGLVLYQIIQ